MRRGPGADRGCAPAMIVEGPGADAEVLGRVYDAQAGGRTLAWEVFADRIRAAPAPLRD